MAYYQYLIGYHQSTLPKSISKMLVESRVMSHLNYALPIMGTSLNMKLFYHIHCLHSQAVGVG